ncbi:23S rRNA (guanosine(2251)-2'-O)-methyltransferase RlmB [Roseomonas fluvialis]|uniref:23S rRNA (Guanosine(2251)-2'-O)-methyltransferase RlmB n=1 Tax=Roseomonas fluvialis TaxID=1750527 RepID=A0ABN6P6F2_9PROT|nr:23S rRNA (guanosine(2251)-2'-O)-methyltransferase RlmB [Roseomonas fluvialis]
MPRPPRRPEGRTPTRPTGAQRPTGRKPRRDDADLPPASRGASAAATRGEAGKPERPPRRGREGGPKAVYRPDPGGPPRAPREDEPRAARGDKPRAARGANPGAARGDKPYAARGESPRGARGGASLPGRGDKPRGSRSEGFRDDAPRARRGDDFGASRDDAFRAPRGDAARTARGRPARVQAEPPAAAIDDTPPPPRPGAGAGSGAYWIYGHHAVLAALSNPRRKPRRLLTTTDAELTLRDAYDGRWRVTPERADRARFATFLTEDAVHQGIALLAEPLEPVQLEDAIAAADGPVLLLDQVTDPRNVGAALRAAAAFGAACVVLQDRHAPHETGTLARAASGALDIVPVVREVNLSRAIAALQRAGFWVLGLAGEGKRTLAEAAPRDRRVALVMGAEEAGLRRLQRETVDELVRLPMAEGVESLNVASAAAVALYEIVRR